MLAGYRPLSTATAGAARPATRTNSPERRWTLRRAGLTWTGCTAVPSEYAMLATKTRYLEMLYPGGMGRCLSAGCC